MKLRQNIGVFFLSATAAIGGVVSFGQHKALQSRAEVTPGVTLTIGTQLLRNSGNTYTLMIQFESISGTDWNNESVMNVRYSKDFVSYATLFNDITINTFSGATYTLNEATNKDCFYFGLWGDKTLFVELSTSFINKSNENSVINNNEIRGLNFASTCTFPSVSGSTTYGLDGEYSANYVNGTRINNALVNYNTADGNGNFSYGYIVKKECLGSVDVSVINDPGNDTFGTLWLSVPDANYGSDVPNLDCGIQTCFALNTCSSILIDGKNINDYSSKMGGVNNVQINRFCRWNCLGIPSGSSFNYNEVKEFKILSGIEIPSSVTYEKYENLATIKYYKSNGGTFRFNSSGSIVKISNDVQELKLAYENIGGSWYQENLGSYMVNMLLLMPGTDIETNTNTTNAVGKYENSGKTFSFYDVNGNQITDWKTNSDERYAWNDGTALFQFISNKDNWSSIKKLVIAKGFYFSSVAYATTGNGPIYETKREYVFQSNDKYDNGAWFESSAVDIFVSNYINMSGTAEEQFSVHYAAAKAAYEELNNAQKAYFQQTFVDEYARFQKWETLNNVTDKFNCNGGTMASLCINNYSLLDGSNNYTWDSISLRFGGYISKTAKEEFDSLGATAYGIEYSYTKDSKQYGGKVPTTATSYVKSFGDAEFASDGEVFQMSLLLKDISKNGNTDYLTTEITAKCYVTIGGNTFYMSSKTYSVKSIAQQYITANVPQYAQHKGIIDYLAGIAA